MGNPWSAPPAKAAAPRGACASCAGASGGGSTVGTPGLLDLELGNVPQLSDDEKREMNAIQGVVDTAAKKVRRIDNGTVNNLVGAVHGIVGHGVLGVVKLE